MLEKDFIEMVDAIDRKRSEVMRGKSQDYANEDKLSNFKRMAEMVRLLRIDITTPGGCARFLTLLKFDRWCNLAYKRTDPVNESVKDTIIDFHNYIDLAHACDFEQTLEHWKRDHRAEVDLDDLEKKNVS